MTDEPATIQRHVAVRHLPEPSGRAVFGGLLIAQAITAASATVEPGFHVYSSHSTFLRPVTATAKERVVYHVDRVANGNSFATRVVRATQGSPDDCVYTATISFQSSRVRVGNVLEYGPPVPDSDGLKPTDIPAELNRTTLAAASHPGSPLQPMSSEVEVSDHRPFGFVLADKPGDCRVRSFVRSQQPLTTQSVPVHQAALAYMSDEIFLGMAIFANPEKLGDGIENVKMGATLSHNLSFHDPTTIQVDKWMVLERTTSWGGNGRVLVHEHMWNLETGRLILTCTQEALIQLKHNDSKNSRL